MLLRIGFIDLRGKIGLLVRIQGWLFINFMLYILYTVLFLGTTVIMTMAFVDEEGFGGAIGIGIFQGLLTVFVVWIVRTLIVYFIPKAPLKIKIMVALVILLAMSGGAKAASD